MLASASNVGLQPPKKQSDIVFFFGSLLTPFPATGSWQALTNDA